MKLGIIVYSKTGNTLSVAEKLKEKLTAAGHSVNIERITAVDEKQSDPKKIQLQKLPDLSGYDALIFGTPVQAFSAAPIMKVYMPQLPSLSGKKAACFVTKGLPLVATGGNQAIALMKGAIESKGGNVVDTAIIRWGGSGRDQRINEMVDKFSKAF